MKYESPNGKMNVPNATWDTSVDVNNISISFFEKTTDIGNSTIDKCASDLIYLISSTNELWALRALDSFGKLESAILYGNLLWAGNYEECLDVLAPPGPNTTGFKGRYCLLTWISSTTTQTLPTNLPISIAICIPNSCQEKDVQLKKDLILPLLGNFHIPVNQNLPFPKVKCHSEDGSWKLSAIIYTTFVTFLLSLVLLASVYDLYLERALKNRTSKDTYLLLDQRKDSFSEKTNYQTVLEENIPNTLSSSKAKTVESLLMCFSAVKNVSLISDTSSKKGQLECFHGIRVLCLAAIILTHVSIHGGEQQSNLVSTMKWYLSFGGFLVLSLGAFAVDSFFFLSAFLMTYLFFKNGPREMKAKDWALFYLHRYLRLTPALALMLGMWITINNYPGNSVLSDNSNSWQMHWWTYLLYINNFIEYSKGMAWTWYLAVDMQFFVISPIFLILLQRWPKFGCAVTFGTILTFCIITGVVCHQNGMIILKKYSYLDGIFDASLTKFIMTYMSYSVLMMPYTRIGPYLIGILGGFYYLKFTSADQHIRKLVVILGWIGATTLFFIVMIVPVISHTNSLANDFYYALSRQLFTLALGWIVFACLTGNGGIVNRILSWKMWFPLSRINYCAYLIQSMIVAEYYKSLRTPVQFFSTATFLMSLGVVFMTYVSSFVATLTFELPFAAMERLLIK